jgi:hypothetical protein
MEDITNTGPKPRKQKRKLINGEERTYLYFRKQIDITFLNKSELKNFEDRCYFLQGKLGCASMKETIKKVVILAANGKLHPYFLYI